MDHFFCDPRLKLKLNPSSNSTTSSNGPNGPNPLQPSFHKHAPTIKIKAVAVPVSPIPNPTPTPTPPSFRPLPPSRPSTRRPTPLSNQNPVRRPSKPAIPLPQNPLPPNPPSKRPNLDPPQPSRVKKARWSAPSTLKSRPLGPPPKLAPARLLSAVELEHSEDTQTDLSDGPSKPTPPLPSLRIQALSSSPATQDSDSDDGAHPHAPPRPIIDRSSRVIARSVDCTSAPYSAIHPLEPALPTGRITSSAQLVGSDRRRFKPWFRVPEGARWPFRPGEIPKLDLMYPAGGHETFMLVVPKESEDEYRPLDDLMNVITTTLGHYLTPEQSLQFFSEPHPIFAPSASTQHVPQHFRFLTQPPPLRVQRSPSEPADEGAQPTRLPAGLDLGDPALDLSGRPLLKSLAKAIRRQNGPEFVELVGWFNRVLGHLVSAGLIRRQIAAMDGLRLPVWETVLGQAYDRQVGPQLAALQGYETWSSNVYGELRPRLVSDLIHLVGLRPGMVFVDLGSGVGNIVLQVALEAGCVAVGFENMAGCCRLARAQMSEAVGRSVQLWGVSLGQPVLMEADFTTDSRVGAWLKRADVVLVNNQVFTPALNESLTLLFLDLRDSTKIISLKPFVAPTKGERRSITERNSHSPLSILGKCEQFEYGRESVSWTDSPGKFYVTEVDRSLVREFQGKERKDRRI